MSLRYTGEATMDQPALRDVERWKDKIEVRLDNRQVFFLFFGSAMVACMLFVLGVIVGKRLETRGRAEAPTLEDPLAVLDRFGGAAAQAVPAPLAFPRALIGSGTTTVSSGKTRAAMLERAERPAKVETKVEPKPKPEPETVERVEKTVKAEAVVRAEPAPAKPTLATTVAAPPVAKPLAVVEAPVPPMPGAATLSNRKLAALPRPLSGPGVPSTRSAAAPASVKAPVVKAVAAAPAAAKPAPVAPAADKGKGKFLLQLSSFPDRAEAEAFARKFAGQNAYVVASEIPGKGTWYRVRVGSYGTMQEATAAKTNFERDHNVIAYVAGSGPAR
jgi:DedD protein